MKRNARFEPWGAALGHRTGFSRPGRLVDVIWRLKHGVFLQGARKATSCGNGHVSQNREPVSFRPGVVRISVHPIATATYHSPGSNV